MSRNAIILSKRLRCSLLSNNSRCFARQLTNKSTNSTNDTHFGFENVSKAEKAEKVHGVFQNVAEKYDLMNDLMSCGIHRLWKDAFVSRLAPMPRSRFLDVAGGTGDITFRIIDHLKHQKNNNKSNNFTHNAGGITGMEEHSNSTNRSRPKSRETVPYEVVVCDISEGMLDVGKGRADQKGYLGIDWICGDAQQLPFPDDHFDCYTIAYGMRNVVDVEKGLREAYRVLRPGGRFMCLEFSQVNNSLLKWAYDQYSFQMIPVIGQVIANDWKSYKYLVESIRKFPDQETYKEMIEDVGFRKVSYENLTFGVTAIHSGFKI